MKTSIYSFFRKLISVAVTWCIFVLGVDGLAWCGHGSYDDSLFLCCGENLTDLYQNGAEMACCHTPSGRDEIYQKDTQLCCGEQYRVDKIYTDKRGIKQERDCCTKHSKIADTFDQTRCCGGYSGKENLVKMSSDTDMCCGSKKFDPRSEFCCEDHDRDTQEIYPTPRTSNSACCKTNMYDTTKEYCIKHNGTVHKIQTDKVPCKGSNDYYDPGTQICCYEGTVQEKPIADGLPRFAIPPVYACREGFIYDTNRFNFEPSSDEKKIKAHMFPKEKRSCGNGSYNPDETRHQEFCCDGTTFRNASNVVKVDCCGTELYDKGKEICCGREIIEKDGQKDCCNGVIYNISEKSCCEPFEIDNTMVCCAVGSTQKIPINKLQKNHTDCCPGRDLLSYNKYDKECVSGQIKPIAISTPKPPRQEEVRGNFPEPCQYCGGKKKSQMTKTCNTRREYKVILTNEKRTEMGTNLTATIVYPPQHRFQSLIIQIRYHCRCFKIGKKYTIYTNRRLSGRSSVYLGHKSLIVRQSKNNQSRRNKLCNFNSHVKQIFNELKGNS